MYYPILTYPILFEEWKCSRDLNLGIKPIYWISNFGRVYSEIVGRILIPAISNGYETVQLAMEDGSRKTFYIHRLVGMLYIINHNPNYFVEINHKDLNRSRNLFFNLEWLSKEDNIKHELANKNKPSIIRQAPSIWKKTSNGESNGMAKLTNSQVECICKYIESGFTIIDILKLMNMDITENNIRILRSIATRRRWKHISINYEFPDKIPTK